MARIALERMPGRGRRAIVKGLEAANAPMLGDVEYRPLTITMREGRRIVGGLLGESFLSWLYVSVLWVSHDHRHKGFGTAIMQAADTEARRRGVKNIYLDTFSFQAPAFYARLGYREFGRLDDFPAGHYRCWLTKAL